MFEPIDFKSLNETDVREEILAPLIRRLGYRSGTKNNVIREQSLRYPRAFIGRKNAKKDPILRGVADYILEAGSTVRWVIEAKAPDVEIDLESVDQAYTYANHPEVRAVYFLLCNGRRLIFFQTNKGPAHTPILDIPYNELESKYSALENLLSPASVLRDHPHIEADVSPPIGKGLRSVVRVTNGVIRHSGNSLNMPALREMQTGISGGSVERDEQGRMVAFLTTIAPTRSMQELNQRLGLNSFEMYSDDLSISTDQRNPTIFRGDRTVLIPAGERLLDIVSWKEIIIPENIQCRVITEASGYLEENRFHGCFKSLMKYQGVGREVRLHGDYEIFVS